VQDDQNSPSGPGSTPYEQPFAVIRVDIPPRFVVPAITDLQDLIGCYTVLAVDRCVDAWG
jgi:hypothetical protein